MERDELRNLLAAWRDGHWQSIVFENPGLSHSWIISDRNIGRLVEKANWIVGSEAVTEALLNRISHWLVDSEETVVELVGMLEQFRVTIHTRRTEKAAKRRVARQRVLKVEPDSPTRQTHPLCVRFPPLFLSGSH